MEYLQDFFALTTVYARSAFYPNLHFTVYSLHYTHSLLLPLVHSLQSVFYTNCSNNLTLLKAKCTKKLDRRLFIIFNTLYSQCSYIIQFKTLVYFGLKKNVESRYPSTVGA